MAEVCGAASTRPSASVTDTVSLAVTPRARSSRASSSWSAESMVKNEVGELGNGIDVDAGKTVGWLDVGRHRQNIRVVRKQPGLGRSRRDALPAWGSPRACSPRPAPDRTAAAWPADPYSCGGVSRCSVSTAVRWSEASSTAAAPASRARQLSLPGRSMSKSWWVCLITATLQAARGQLRQHALDQRGLAAAAVACDAKHVHVVCLSD